jgi:HJR/Mrr/RecB family endonuclease
MIAPPAVFQVDDLYSSEDIQQTLSVGNAGGVRISTGGNGTVARVIVMTSVVSARQASENPYHDRIEQDILVYTGAGREGNQSLAGVNKRIPQQLDLAFPIYGFLLIGSRRDKNFGPKRWRFLGLLEYLRHYPETQTDVRGRVRQVWLFEFRIHREPEIVPVQNDLAVSLEVIQAARATHYVSEKDREVAPMNVLGNSEDAKEDAAQIEAVRKQLLASSPQQFEHIIRDVLVRTGFESVNVTKYSQDGGIDVNAFAGKLMWPLQNLLLQIQAKRWLHTIGRKEVAELRGSLQPFARGAIVTTSHFSKAAISEASDPGKNPIVLVNGYDFASLIKSTGLKLA